MKFALVILAVVAAASAQFNTGAYQPYNQGRYNPFNRNVYNRNQYSTYRPFASSTFAPSIYSTPAPFSYSTPAPFAFSTPAPVYSTPAPVYSTPAPLPVVAKYNNLDAANANIVKQVSEINPDGSYAYAYETDNGIAAQEQGVPKSLGGNPPAVAEQVQGGFSYTSPEGVPVSISYIADENGFQPAGNVLPVAPEIPPQIARALAYIAANPSKYQAPAQK